MTTYYPVQHATVLTTVVVASSFDRALAGEKAFYVPRADVTGSPWLNWFTWSEPRVTRTWRDGNGATHYVFARDLVVTFDIPAVDADDAVDQFECSTVAIDYELRGRDILALESLAPFA